MIELQNFKNHLKTYREVVQSRQGHADPEFGHIWRVIEVRDHMLVKVFDKLEMLLTVMKDRQERLEREYWNTK